MKADSWMEREHVSNSVTIQKAFLSVALVPIIKENFCPKMCSLVSCGDCINQGETTVARQPRSQCVWAERPPAWLPPQAVPAPGTAPTPTNLPLSCLVILGPLGCSPITCHLQRGPADAPQELP